MALAGTMTPDRVEQTVPDSSKLVRQSPPYPAGKFPYRSSGGLASDITEVECDHWRKQFAAAFGLAHFHEIIQKLEELRLARRLLEEVSGTGFGMSSKTDTAKGFSLPGNSQSHPDSDNEDRSRPSRPKSPRSKGAHRIRRKEEGFMRRESSLHELAEDPREALDPVDAGPIRSPLPTVRHQPYAMSEERLSRSPRSQECIALSYESTAERILQHKEYSEKLNPCLDQLESSRGLPSIVIEDPREESSFGNAFTQAPLSSLAQVHPDPCLSTCGMSCPSGAQSPRSLLNLENPTSNSLTYSPVGSPQLGPCFRVPQGQSSSESSNQSYGDIPSPLSYQAPVNPGLEAHLGKQVQRLMLWNDGRDSSETMMNDGTIDNTDLQLLDEVLWQDLGRPGARDEPQVVPTSSHQLLSTEQQTRMTNCSPGRSIGESTSLQCEYSSNSSGYRRCSSTIPIPSSSNAHLENPTIGLPSWNRSIIPRDNHLEDFEIPRIVASFEPSRTRRRSSGPGVLPWPSLNLPLVGASERLKAGLNPKEVERAMGSLLKRTPEELARPDSDGDTMLMLLVGNPDEFAEKKAYLVPLVERLSNTGDALTTTNNRGEDALYLAAMNCPNIPYVAGYLAAAMLRKGIDISQRHYHTRGDTLIHAVASRGDSHGEVLAELLALRTSQGNAVFDLSKRNYYGKTALHIAVESHADPSTPTGRSSVRSVQVLLEHDLEMSTAVTKCGDTVLHMAITTSCDPELVKILLVGAGGATVNARNREENTALHMAAAVPDTVSLERQMEVCWLLIEAGAEINVKNRRGETPLALVSEERKDAIRRILCRKT